MRAQERQGDRRLKMLNEALERPWPSRLLVYGKRNNRSISFFFFDIREMYYFVLVYASSAHQLPVTGPGTRRRRRNRVLKSI